jgi:hypothetical protein
MDAQNQEKKLPTKEEVIKFYKEQIEVAKFRRDLAEILSQTADYDARRAESIAKQAHFSGPRPSQVNNDLPEGVIPHTVTQEDIDNNPELAEQGIKVGDVIGITEKPDFEATEEEEKEQPVRQLKKD